MTVTTRICLDALRSARARREHYVGEWLPEPVPADADWVAGGARAGDPADRVSLDESLSMAMLVVLETMTPAERVCFVLHDVFRYRFSEIADIVRRSPDACRRLASSARRRVRESRRSPVSAAEHRTVMEAFQRALESGDLDGLIAVLDPGVVAVGDGGGVVDAAMEPVVGAAAVAAYLLRLRRMPGLRFDVQAVNGREGVVLRAGEGPPLAVATAAVRAERVHRIWVMRNPQKLTAWRG